MWQHPTGSISKPPPTWRNYLQHSIDLPSVSSIDWPAPDREAPPTPPDWPSLVQTRTPHPKQAWFLESGAKRKVIRAGRRGGKTIGIAILALRAFQAGRRVLYATPTQEQI